MLTTLDLEEQPRTSLAALFCVITFRVDRLKQMNTLQNNNSNDIEPESTQFGDCNEGGRKHVHYQFQMTNH